MNCAVCGALEKATKNIPFDYKGHVIIAKDAKVFSCKQCGEVYLTQKEGKRFQSIMEQVDRGRARTETYEVVVG